MLHFLKMRTMTSFSFTKHLSALLLALLLAGNLFSQTTWTGSANTDWGNGANWSAGVPDTTDDVTIPDVTNDPTIGAAGAVAKSVIIGPGSALSISVTGTLAVNGAAGDGIENNGTLNNSGILAIGNVANLGGNGIHNTGSGILNNNSDGQITIDRTTSRGVSNSGTFNNYSTLTIGSMGSIGGSAVRNSGIFNNNTGGQITMDRRGLFNSNNGTINNFATITIGSTVSPGSTGLNNEGIFNNNTGGQITIDRSTTAGLVNCCGATFTNLATITIGSTVSPGSTGLDNESIFNNNTGGQITINRSAETGLENSGTFTNQASINVGSTESVGIYGINNFGGDFNNNTGGQITINRSTETGFYNALGNVTNQAAIHIGGTADVGGFGVLNEDVFFNNTGGQIHIDRTTDRGLVNAGTFTNQASIVIGSTANVGNHGMSNHSTFFNNTGGQIQIDRATISGIYLEGIDFSNAANIIIGALVPMTDLITFEENTTGTFTNNTGGILSGTGNVPPANFNHNGGTLSPGYSAGTMTFDAGEDFNASTLSMEISETAGVVSKDLVAVSGNAALTGATLNVVAGGTVPGGTHQLMSFTGNPGSTQFTTVNLPALCGGCSLVYSATGVSLNNSMACFPNLMLNNLMLATGTYRSQGDLTSDNSTVGNGKTVEFKSDTVVLLGAGFEVQLGGVFEAVISACQ